MNASYINIINEMAVTNAKMKTKMLRKFDENLQVHELWVSELRLALFDQLEGI